MDTDDPIDPLPELMAHITRRVTLRSEQDGRDSRFLEAYLDRDGNLHIDGQDLGPSTAIVSSDGEYEWFETIRAEHLPRLRELLGLDPDEDLLTGLARDWNGTEAGDLETIIRKSGIPVERFVWSG